MEQDLDRMSGDCNTRRSTGICLGMVMKLSIRNSIKVSQIKENNSLFVVYDDSVVSNPITAEHSDRHLVNILISTGRDSSKSISFRPWAIGTFCYSR
jgi:hypothetical protein